MEFLALGLNHTTAPVEVRERVAASGECLPLALAELRGRLHEVVPETAILSTCNRTEVYCVTPSPDVAHRAIAGWMAERGRLDGAATLERHLYALRDDQAVRHAFRVASGLDSMVLGEPQILGQMKQAARAAQEAAALGTHLHQLFQRTFAVAKEVRSRTEIGAHSVSLAAASVRMAQRTLPDLSAASVLFVGAGEMIELVATHFAARQPLAITIVNRSAERGATLARRLGGRAVGLAQLPDELAAHDVVVSCTASLLPIIGLGLAQRAMALRGHAPTVMIDLAVPRDIEPEVARLPGMSLHTVDDLGRIVDEGLGQRAAAVAQAESIIDSRVGTFMHGRADREANAGIRRLRERGDAIARAELEHARRRLARGEDAEAVLESLAHRLSAKFLHGPTTLLREARDPAQGLQSVLERLLPAEAAPVA